MYDGTGIQMKSNQYKLNLIFDLIINTAVFNTGIAVCMKIRI